MVLAPLAAAQARNMFAHCGYSACRFHACLVDVMVNEIVSQLGHKPLEVTKRPVAVGVRLQPILQALEQHHAVGLYGMGGIGKTTLAKILYNQLQKAYVNHCSYVEVGQMGQTASVRRPFIEERQRQMLQELCNLKGPFAGMDRNSSELQHRLRDNCVLLVLDDVWTNDQMEGLLATLPRGSKLIVTSRNRQLLQTHFTRCFGSAFRCLEVDLLSDHASRELLCLHAYGQWKPPSRTAPKAAELLGAIAAICSNLPLTLSVAGAFMAMHPDTEIWKDMCYRLQKAQDLDGQNDSMFATLRISYDVLDPALQTMLMDVACVLLGQTAAIAVRAWGQGGRLGLANLQMLSLVTLERGILGMHDQMRDALRALACQSSSDKHAGYYAWDKEAPELLNTRQGRQVSPRVLVHVPTYS